MRQIVLTIKCTIVHFTSEDTAKIENLTIIRWINTFKWLILTFIWVEGTLVLWQFNTQMLQNLPALFGLRTPLSRRLCHRSVQQHCQGCVCAGVSQNSSAGWHSES